MEQWLFLRVTAEDGTGWRWERHDDEGRVIEAASRTFADYSQALGDAMKHGYLSDVKTLP
ncbi:MAG: hypothetical protein V7640_2646 [Betaproteobacteria bacterium]|jgi:hypothetical protein